MTTTMIIEQLLMEWAQLDSEECTVTSARGPVSFRTFAFPKTQLYPVLSFKLHIEHDMALATVHAAVHHAVQDRKLRCEAEWDEDYHWVSVSSSEHGYAIMESSFVAAYLGAYVGLLKKMKEASAP